MRLLITGGFGYLGGRVALALAAAMPEEEVCLSTRTDRRPEWWRSGEICRMDLLDESTTDQACEGAKAVIHLAALNEIESAHDPEKALLVNTLGTLRLLRSAQRAGVSRFVYVSTAHVYGTSLTGLVTEATVPRPVHPYAWTHRAAEDIVLAAHEQRTLTGVVLRLSNGFGAPADPGVERWTLVVNDLCRQAVTSRKLLLRSSGLQRRDFITLFDVCRAIRHVLELPPAACGDGLFNLGGENPLRIIDLGNLIAERCQAVLGFRPAIERPQPTPTESSAELNYSIEKLKGTGFYLAGNISQEIDQTLLLCARAFGVVHQ